MNENEIKTKSDLVIRETSDLAVVDQTTYSLAGDYLKEISKAEKGIKAYWKPIKSKAYDSWKSIKAKENEMLDPVLKAKENVKHNMSDYLLILEDEKAKAEKEANAVAEKYGVEVILPSNTDKLNGVSTSTSYDINSIDIEKLPKEFNGIIIVKADESAIKKLIKMSKGKIEIPGVSYSKKKIVKTTGR